MDKIINEQTKRLGFLEAKIETLTNMIRKKLLEKEKKERKNPMMYVGSIVELIEEINGQPIVKIIDQQKKK